MKKDSSSKIIFFNGPSSSGKTTLAKYLQQHLDEPFLHIGIDSAIYMLPEKMNDYKGDMQPRDGFYWTKSQDASGRELVHLQMGDYGKKVYATYQKVVVCMAEQGHNIIVDDVCLDYQHFSKWQQLLSDFKVIYVGFKVPEAVLEQREKARGDRMIGSARTQNLVVHNNIKYDVELDTSTASPQQCMQAIYSIYSKM